MLNFTSDLITAYKKDNTRAYWLLRLYYGDESNFIGFGSKPVVVGSDVYWEALSLGRFGQSTDLDDFIVSNGTMSVTLPNTPKAVEGGRFSDMFVSKKFTNRKWELFQASDGVTFSTDNMIASGIIGADFDNTDTEITVRLNDWWIRYDIHVPTRRVTNDIYPNAPEKNIDEPIPMWYGDFDTEDDVPAGSDWELWRTKGKAPAVIVEKGKTDENVHCLPDTDKVAAVVLNQLNVKNVFMYNQTYLACNQASVTLNANPANNTENLIKFTGNIFFYYVPITRDTGDGTATITNGSNIFDEDFTTSGNMDTVGASLKTFIVEMGEVKNLGRINPVGSTTIELLAHFGTFTGDPIDGAALGNFYAYGIEEDPKNEAFTWKGAAYQDLDIGDFWTAEQKEAVDLTALTFGIAINAAGGGTGDVDIKSIGLKIKATADKQYTIRIVTQRASRLINGAYRYEEHGYEQEIRTPGDSEIETVFVSGKGREYGSWIEADSRTNGYNGTSAPDLIENPVYIIEDILRNELGLTSSEIDYASFDVAGNTTNGTIKDVFNENNTTDIKFAFSQHKITTAKLLIRKICKLSGLYFFWSAGKAKVVARKRTYAAVDDTIDFRYIAYQSPENSSVQKPKTSMTMLADIINYFTVEYDFDYGANKTIKSRTPDENVSLKDDTSRDDYSFDSTYLKSTVKFDLTPDETTADNLGEALISYLKDRKSIIEIETTSPRWNHLENTDIINIDNFTSDFTLFGTEISLTNTFMIINKSATLNGSRFTLVKLPGSV